MMTGPGGESMACQESLSSSHDKRNETISQPRGDFEKDFKRSTSGNSSTPPTPYMTFGKVRSQASWRNLVTAADMGESYLGGPKYERGQGKSDMSNQVVEVRQTWM
jgi:hypothetical protein